MAYGIIGFSQVGANGFNNNLPSPSIWGDCSSQELTDEAVGYFKYEDFASPVTLPGLFTAATGSGSFVYATTTATINSITVLADRVVRVTTAAAAHDAEVIVIKPIGPIVAGSGKKFWTETAIALPSITATQGIFFGLAINKVGITADATNSTVGVISNESTTLASNKIQTGSFIGIVGISNGTTTQFDAVYMNQPTYSTTPTSVAARPSGGSSSSATKGTYNYIQTDLLNSASIAANGGGTANSTPAVVPVIAGPNSGGTAVAAVFTKLGIRYDGQQYLYFYVNGYQAAKVTVDATFDQTSDYGVLLSLTGNAVTLDVDFVRAAAKVA